MIITFAMTFAGNLYRANIENGSKIKIGSGKKDNIIIPAFGDGKMIVSYSGGKVGIRTKHIFGFSESDCPLKKMICVDEKSRCFVYLDFYEGENDEKIQLPYNGVINVGRRQDNDIVLAVPFISNNHFILRCEAGNIRIEDRNSTNGIYVNGKRTNVATKLRSGDTVAVYTVCIKIINGELIFENAKDKVKNNLRREFGATGLESGDCERPKYKRSPRRQEALPDEDIILAPAPSKPQGHGRNRSMFTSLISSGTMLGVSVLTGVASPALIAARAAGMVGPVANIFLNDSSGKKGKKKLEKYEQLIREKYGAYIEDQAARIEKVADKQREILARENPSPEECFEMLFDLKTSLWERMPVNRDFLDVRIGMGYEDLCVNVKGRNENSDFRMENDEVKELSERLIEATRIVDNVPARLRLKEYSTFGFVGDRKKTVNLVKNILTVLTAVHCYEDVRIVGFFDESEREIWEMLRWFPHIWNKDKNMRFLSFSREETHKLCEILCDTLKGRESEVGSSNGRNAPTALPHYIILWGTEEGVKNEELFTKLCTSDTSVGFTSLFMFDDVYRLPPECQFIVDLSNEPKAYPKEAVNKKFCFTADNALNEKRFDAYARRMSAIEFESFGFNKSLPNSISFLEGFRVRTVEELDAFSRWSNSGTERSLAAPIGVLDTGEAFFLDIHEKASGPHGLVAGTTGSGKSELLQTWILSMAVNYHPHDVAFVIIDYKGGGLANTLEPLPHVVGKITNIDSNINRSLLSLKSEIDRRYRLFEKYGVYHISKYQQLYKSGKATEPMPCLIIVSDEFAELKRDEPEFISELIKTARVGRSIGIHLVLATQKPGGIVDDQISSNSKFRICLKVQDVTDSREMIKRPDAAKLTRAGRAYIRVGEDEYFDLFQSFWSGAPYITEGTMRAAKENLLKIVDLSGKRTKIKPTAFRAKSSFEDELHVIVDYLRDVAQGHSVKKLEGPWKPELPEKLDYDDLKITSGFSEDGWKGNLPWLKIPVGLYDYPQQQKQGVQYIDLHEDGHYKIFGAPGSGKTTLLKSIIMSLSKYYTPSQVNIYALDCGSWGLSAFSQLPHVGSVALLPEAEKFDKFERMMLEELQSRKNIILRSATGSLKDYREEVSEDLPAIVIVVDGMLTLLKTYPDMEQFFVKIASEGAAFGMYLIYTNNSVSNEKMSITNNIKSGIAFELTERGDYSLVVGRLDGVKAPAKQGRALVKHDVPVEFQTVMYADGDSEKERNANVRSIAEKMNAMWNGVRPKPIPVMPEHIGQSEMLQSYRKRDVLPLGLSFRDISAAQVDLSEKYTLLITGSAGCGKSQFLSKAVQLIRASQFDSDVFVFDSKKMSLSDLKENAQAYVLSDDNEKVGSVISELIEMLNVRKRAENAARQSQGDDFNEKAFVDSLRQIVIVIDDLKFFVDSVSNADKDSMERICRLAQNLGVIVLCAARTLDICRYNEIESLTRVIVANQNGLALEGSPVDHSFFRNTLKYSERDIAVKDGNAYLYTDGECRMIKIMN